MASDLQNCQAVGCMAMGRAVPKGGDALEGLVRVQDYRRDARSLAQVLCDRHAAAMGFTPGETAVDADTAQYQGPGGLVGSGEKSPPREFAGFTPAKTPTKKARRKKAWRGKDHQVETAAVMDDARVKKDDQMKGLTVKGQKGKRRAVECVETGERFTTSRDAAAAAGRSGCVMSKALHGDGLVHGKHYRFVEAEPADRSYPKKIKREKREKREKGPVNGGKIIHQAMLTHQRMAALMAALCRGSKRAPDAAAVEAVIVWAKQVETGMTLLAGIEAGTHGIVIEAGEVRAA